MRMVPKDGQPAEAPWRLVLMTVLPCVENRSDQHAAHAVRGRIDGKDLLRLDLTDAGFDASVLSECRVRVIEHHAEERLLEKRLMIVGQQGWGKARGRQRTDATRVVGQIRALTRVRCVWETMRAARNRLAVGAPDWQRAHSQQAWMERDGPRREDARGPAGEAERLALAQERGAQGRHRREALCAETAPA